VKSTNENEISPFGSLQAHWKCMNPRKSAFQSIMGRQGENTYWERP